MSTREDLDGQGTKDHEGAWVAWTHDDGVHVYRVFGDELEASRWALSQGYYIQVSFVRYGEDVSEAVQ